MEFGFLECPKVKTFVITCESLVLHNWLKTFVKTTGYARGWLVGRDSEWECWKIQYLQSADCTGLRNLELGILRGFFFFFNLQESAQILSVHLMSFDNCEHPYNHHCKQDVECFHHSGKSSCVLVHPVFSCPRDNHCSNFHHHRLSLQVLGLHRNALKQYFLLFFPLDFFTQQNVLEIGPCCVYQ